MTQIVTEKNFLKTLETLRDQVKAALSGCRETVYSAMAKAWRIVLLLRSDKKLQAKFIRRAKLKVATKGKAALQVVTEVMAFVMGAKTALKKKLAWKRGRVIEFLHDQGIKIAKIAAEIQSRGGIEAVLKQAAKLQPRRAKRSASTKTNAKEFKAHVAETRPKQDRNEYGDMSARSPATTQRNDRPLIMPVLISLSDRDALEDLPVDSKARIVVKRTNENGVKIAVIRIKKSKPTAHKLEDDDAWN